jgi:hypothetical protein
MFTGLCARRLRAGGQSQVFTMIAAGCFVRTGWDGTKGGSSECFAISTAEKVEVA